MFYCVCEVAVLLCVLAYIVVKLFAILLSVLVYLPRGSNFLCDLLVCCVLCWYKSVVRLFGRLFAVGLSVPID